jgi:Fur family ferric uptake transcriptional regulator
MSKFKIIESVFLKYRLKKTKFRKELFKLFHDSSNSLSVKYIIKFFSSSIDKVSIYRALDSFEKSGLIHKVPDKNNLLRYSLCQSECSPKKHSHDHAHLLCSICNETYCLNDFSLPSIKNHKGFLINNFKIILEGNCVTCQNNLVV